MKPIHWMPLIGIVLLACIFPVQGAPDNGPGFVTNQMNVTLSLLPAEAEIGMNETTTYDVVGVCTPPGAMNETPCIGSYNITVSLDDGMVGEITEIAFPEGADQTAIGTVPGDSVWAMAQNLTPPGAAGENQTLFTVTVRGDAAGTTGITLTPETIVDREGGTPTVTAVPANLTVTGEAGLKANFTADVTSGEAPLTVHFTDLSTGNVTVWYWDFGDGAFSTEQNPVHTYNTSGNFSVNLTVADDTGASDNLEIPGYINVSEAPPVIVPVLFFTPQNASVNAGDTVEYALILNTAPDGLAGYTLNVDSGVEGVAEIVNVSYPDWAMPTNTSALPDMIVEIKAGDMMDNITAGATNVSLANITVRGVMEGQANLSVEVVRMTADGGGPIMPDMMTASLNVTPIAPPSPLPGYQKPPTDPNNDGRYEDLNGNEEIEYDDVVALNANMQWIEENNLVPLFDFNTNGRIDYDDVVMLFDMI